MGKRSALAAHLILRGAGLAAAKARVCTAAGLAGRDGGRMVGLADPLLVVPSRSTPRIQEMHITLGHMLCAALEIELFPT